MKQGRGLSPYFMDALMYNTGPGLNPFLRTVLNDETLCLEIRENSINIYYRGGNLIRIDEQKENFLAFFGRKYIINPEQTKLSPEISAQEIKDGRDVELWVGSIPFLKYEMDRWLHIHPKDEREFQQVIVRENNFGNLAKATDYFICDIEYDTECGRFDLIAVRWPSSGENRKRNSNLGMAFIEMKYMDKSMVHSSGILTHICDLEKYFRKTQDYFAQLKQEMKRVFNQKLTLGLINNQKPIEAFDEDAPDLILVLANHDPDSRILINELLKIRSIIPTLPFKIKFAVGNFMGYGLYQNCIFEYEEFMNRFSTQIYSQAKQVDIL